MLDLYLVEQVINATIWRVFTNFTTPVHLKNIDITFDTFFNC